MDSNKRARTKCISHWSVSLAEFVVSVLAISTVTCVQNLLLYFLFPDEAPSMLTNIIRLKSQLSDFIEPDFGLLDQLYVLGVLTRKQRSKILAGDRATYERTEALLDLLTTEEHCDKFLKALQRTAQQHVVNFITRNGGQNDT